MKKTIRSLVNKAICAAFVVLGAANVCAEITQKDLMYNGEKVGYQVFGLGEAGNETAVVFTKTGADIPWSVPYDLVNVEFLVVGGGGGGGGSAWYDSKSPTLAGAGGGGGGVITGYVNFDGNSTVLINVGQGGEGGKHIEYKTGTNDENTSGSGASSSGSPSVVKVGDVEYVKAMGGGNCQGLLNHGGEGASNGGCRKCEGDGICSCLNTVRMTEEDKDAKKDKYFYYDKRYVFNVNRFGNEGGCTYKAEKPAAAGGGGGAAGVGGRAETLSNTKTGYTNGGAGGPGFESMITGVRLVFGSGGGGGTSRKQVKGNYPKGGEGGKGGEGAGDGAKRGTNDDVKHGGDAIANQGGGGGGAAYKGNGGDGGSGIVIFRYVLTPVKPVAVINLTYTGEELVGVHNGTGYYFERNSNKAINPGTYTAVAKLHEGCTWSDGTTDDVIVTWKIWPRMPEASMVAAENGYIVRGLGDNGNEVAVVFTNENATAISWKAPSAIDNAQFLVVGGGGGGGADNLTDERSLGGAGGGGGGVVTGSVPLSGSDIISVTVGGGGLGGAVKKNPAGETGALGASYAGANSVVTINNAEDFYVVAFGGGRDNGAKSDSKYEDGNVGGIGGSNGGNKSRVATAQGEPLKGQIQGSRSCTNGEMLGSKGGVSSNSGEYASHGGGGACGAGVDYKGGEGYESSITGKALVYGSGGGGGNAGSSGGVGGTGAGNGNLSREEVYGFDALPNQGGGGGGSGGGEGLAVGTKTGGNGGSGIVAFRFAYSEVASVDGLGYLNLADALTAAVENGKILTLVANVGDISLDNSLALKTDVYSVGTITLNNINAVLTANKDVNVESGVENYEVVEAVENGVYTYSLQVSDRTITLPAVTGATWYYNGAAVDGDTITVSNGTEVTLTLKANEGYQFEGGVESITVDLGSITGNITISDDKYSAPSEKQPSGKINYFQTLNHSGRMGFEAQFNDLYAKKSLIVKVYDAEGNQLTETKYQKSNYPLSYFGGKNVLTCSMVIGLVDGYSPSSTWGMTEVKVDKLTVGNMPAKVELWVDDELVDTRNSGLTNPEVYQSFDFIYKEASVGSTLYASLGAAVEAAGAGAEVVLLANVSADLSLDKSITLNLNEKAYTGTITLTDVDAVLTAPAGLTVVTTVANSEVKFENGAYTVVEAASATLTYAQFNELIRIAAGGVYDGNGITVTLKDSERSYQNNKTAQFFVGATNVNITDPVETVKVSNVNFVFEDDVTDNAYTSGELQVFAKYIEFTGCTFNGVAVSPWGKSNSENAETATFTNCTWKNLSGRYGIHQNRASNLTVTNCKFENCERGIHTNSSTVKSIEITGNTFTGIGAGYGVLCLAESNGDLSKATLNISGNVAEGQVMLRQLSSTVTYEQVSAILDTTNNTYGTAYVSGSTEPKPPVAKIGSAKYASLQAAISAVKNGETITLVDNITENVTVTETVGLYYTIDGAGKTMNGTISVNALSDTNDNRRITIKNINFVDATDADVDFISSVNTNHYPRITVEGCTFTGSGDNGDVAVRLKSSHSVVIKDCTGTGLHSFLQNTSGWNLTIEKVTVTDSKSGLALGTVQGVTISGCNIDVAGYGIRLDAQYNNNAVLESNTVSAFIPVVVRRAEVESSVTVSGSNTMTPSNTDNLWFAAGTSEYEANGAMPTAPTGKVVVTLNDANLPASGVYGNYAVAVVNGVKYITLKDAVAAVADGGVIMLIANETFTEANRTSSGGSWYEGLYYVGDKSFTINLNGFTITQNGAVNDYLMLFKNEGSKANTITLQNGTMDAGSTAYCAICTSSASTQKIIVNLENVNVIGNNSNGSVLKIRGGTELNAKAGTKITGKNSYLGIECVASTVNIYDGAEIYMNGTGSYNGCLVGVASRGTVNVYDGYGKGVSGGFIAMTSGGTINVFGGEWIANTDGTYANDNKSVLIAQSENGVKSIVNVSGGIFKGGYNCYGNAAGDAQINITGGNFNSDPTTYVVDGYLTVENTAGTYDVAKAVAKIGAGYYTNLVDAFKAATEGCTIEILSDVTIDYKWDCRDYATGGSHSQFKESVTINGNGHTLKFTGTVNDSNWNTIFRFEENATVNNLTVDISEATGAQRVISAKKSLTVDGLTVVGSAKYGIIFGEGASAADLAAAEIVVKNSTLTGTRRAISDNEGGKDVKSVAITDNTLNANVYASASESITFNNNTAAGEVDLRSYTVENVLSVEAKGNTLNAGVKNYIYAKNIDAQEGFTAERVPTTVSTYEQLIAALAEDNAYVVLADDITATATQSSGYGKAGIVVEAGDVLDGNDKTLTINGANATWDCAIAMKGGEVRNLTIAGAMRGVFMPGANGDVVIDNCKFQDVIYTFNSDGGSKDYTVTIKNTELNGWTSFSDVHKAVVFDTCTFAKGNGYAYCRPYQATTFNNCSFSDDFAFDCSRVADNELAFNECTYNGQAITSENAFDLFGDGAKVLVNGAPADYTRVAQVGEQIFADLQEAITAAAPNGTVTLLKDVVVDEWKMVTEDYNIASGELITLTMNGLTIDGNGKTLTVNDIESAGNGGYLFQGATSLTVKNLTINVAAGLVGGIALKAGTIENVTFNGGKYAVLPGSGDVIVKDCTFNDITGYAVYFEEDRDNLEITGNTFNCADSAYAVTLRGGADFTNNTVNTGRVNLADSASGTVSGNNFGMERFKVYNGATATITGNTINNLVFNDANVPQNSTFTGNTLSTEAQAVLDAMNFVAQVGDNYYTSINAALAAAQDGDTVYVFAGDYTQDLVIDKDITVIGETTDTGYQLAAIWGQLQITADGATVKGFYVYDGDTAAYVNAKDVLIEGCELVGAGWAGLYQSYTDGTVTFKDSTIVGATYGIHFDGSDGGNIIIDNCKIQGWTSFASTINNVAISNSEFAEGYYNQLRFYQNAQLTNVTFNENMTIDFGKDDVDASFSGCSVENGGSLLDVIYLDDIYNMGVDVTIDDAPVVLVAKIGDKYYTTLQAALDAAVAGTGNVTVEILSDIDLTGTDWNPVTVSAPGYPFVTVNGNNKTIKGLNDMLFAGTWAGKSGLVINDLTIADSTIVNDEDDAQGTVGVGAFIGFPQASATVTLNNCHLRNSTVNGGHWTGGLIGYAAGYAGTDGPVFMTLTITNCSVTASTITGKGSAGGIIGHGSGNAWTDVIIVDSTVSGNTITSTGSSNNKAGSVMGTIGAAGQPTTVNGVTKTGGMAVSVTTAGNTVKSADTVITTIYGRQGTSTGLLEVTGGTYEANPIEEGVAYASPIDGYKIAQNTDGTYGLKSALPGEGTEASPYIIATVEDLVYFRDYVNSGKTKFNAPGVYIALGDNIDLSSIDNWIPIGVQEYDAKYVPVDPTKVFRGIFDGNGRVISNLKMSKTLGGADPANDAANLGLFGVTGEGAVIKNLTISNVTVNSDGRNVAAVVGHAHKTTLENITVNGKIEITGGHYVAGVCGLTRTMVAGKNLTVSGGAGSFINGQNMVGGIFPEIQALWGLGYSQSFSSLAVENIAINGRGGVGGILGMLAGNGTVTDVSVKNVVLTGRTDYQGDAMGRIRMGLVAGLMGGNGPETIANIVAENVSGKNLDGNAVVLPVIGANYDASSNATEAKIGDKYYATFAKAYAAAQAGDTIELLADIEASEVILIDKNLTINGNGHKVTSSATRVFRVTAADTEVTLNDVNMVSTAVRVGTNDIRGISIDDVNNVKLTLNNCSVDFTDASANDWAYAVNVTGGSNHTLTVNGGTYEGANVINVRGENNTVVVKNATLNSLYPDNEQYYGAGIWVEQEKGSSVKATGNTFNGTNALAFNLGTGTSLTASNNTDNTSVGAAFAVAKIGDKGYMTLASAIAAVKNGETIVLVKDCAEKVTISQKSNVKFTIDGDGHEFTGTITVNNRNTTASLTLKDIAFVSNVNDRQIVTIAKANYVTIDGCSFAGNGTGYGIKLENSNNNNIVVKNTTASNLFDFVYSSKRVNGFTAENITATDVCYGFFLSYGQDLMFTNVNVTASDCGIAMNNYNSSTATFADCKLTAKWPVYMQSKSASNAYTLVFNGTNVLTTSVAGDDLIYVEPTAAVFKAIVNDDNLDMSRCSGFVASIGNTYYNNLQRAVDAAEDGETVSVANDAVLTWDGSTKVDGKYAAYVCVAGKSVTIDLNGKKLTGDTDAMGSTALFAVFASDEGGALTMIDSIGDGSVAVSGATKSYCFFMGYEPGAKLTVEGGSYSLANASDSMIYSGGASDIVTIKGGVFHLGNVGTGTNGQPWIFNAYQQNANSVTVSGGTFNADVGHQFWANEVMISETLACKANGNGTWTIVPAVAYVAEKATSQGAVSRNVGYATFAEAIAAAEKHNAVMTILAGSYDEDLNIDKDITVIGETTDDGYQLVEILGRVNVTADGATVKGLYVYDDDTALYINAKDVLIEGCELVGAGWAGLYQSYTDGTVTFKDSTIVGATYGIHFDGSEGGNIIIDNCKIQGWTSFASTINKVTIKDTEFAEGYENQLRFYQDAELTNVTFNEKMTVDFGKDDVDASFTGCTVVDTNADGIVKPLTDVIYKGDIVDMGVDVTIDGVPMYVDAKIGDTFYLTIADAIAAAQAGDAIKLVRDIDLGGAKITVPAGKNITIDLNGKTVSGTHGAEYAMIHVQNGAYMTIDDTVGGGKISCAAGGNNIGAAIWVEGALVQNAGTIEMTGTWTLGFNVDLRPNAWGTAHTVPASFVMNGGKIVSTDTAVRVASNSSDSYPELGVNFTMNGGEIESAWDAIFVQHLYAGDLNINIENGSVSGANSALRIYGDTGSDVDILVKNGAFTGPIKIAEAYVGTDAIAISGGVFSVPVEESCCAEGYIPVAYADGTYGVKPGVFTVRLNGAGFETLQAALDAAQAGDNEIVLLDDSDETVIVSQTEGVNITIDGDGYTYTGRINVHGNSRFSDETLTIMNFDFYTEKASHNFIWSDSQVAPARYPHNVTIVDCAFEAGRDVVDSVVGIRLRQGNNINVVNCSAYRLHSLIQATSCGGDGIYVESVEIDKCKNGMSFGTSNFSVVDSEIDTTGAGSYGIRADGSGAYTATVEDCVIDAYIPVLVRNTADDGFTLTVAGDNHFMADNGLMENGESYLVVFSKGDVDAEKAPVAPETTFNLVIEDGSLDPSKVYPGFEALVGTKYFGQLEDAVAAAQNGDTVTVLKNVGTDAAIIVNKVIAIDLNGKTIAATQNDTAGDGVFCVVAPGVLTINDSVGTGVINGVGDNNYNMAIWAKDGGKVVINGGSFTNVGATDTNDPNAHFDLIYVKNGGEVVVNGGHFECETPAFTLNSHDTLKGTITVNGGTFVGFDPRNNAAETAGTTFMAPGKFTMANGNNYVVVEPGSYMLNGVYCAKGTVADIDAAVVGAVTLTTIDGVITAKATFTFKVTAVDTVNPENSPYELTGGTLRPGKTVAVKYIDLATGEESWAKPESDTVTFKLVIK